MKVDEIFDKLRDLCYPIPQAKRALLKILKDNLPQGKDIANDWFSGYNRAIQDCRDKIEEVLR